MLTEAQKNHWFWILLGVMFFLVVAISFTRFFVAKEYLIFADIDCDPTVEHCFVYECDPETEECTGDPEEDTWYYKKMTKKAANVILCDPNDARCVAQTCFEEEEDCTYRYCDEISAEENGTVCSDPETYNAEHPVEEAESIEESSETEIEGTVEESGETIPETGTNTESENTPSETTAASEEELL